MVSLEPSITHLLLYQIDGAIVFESGQPEDSSLASSVLEQVCSTVVGTALDPNGASLVVATTPVFALSITHIFGHSGSPEIF
jgi:hypothetical protein